MQNNNTIGRKVSKIRYKSKETKVGQARGYVFLLVLLFMLLPSIGKISAFGIPEKRPEQ